MSTDEATPSEVEQDAAAQEPAEAGNEAQGAEVDFERILSGDEAYTADISAKLNGDAPTVTETEKAPEKPEAEEEAKPVVPDPDEVVETITFRGKDYPVTRKDQKALLQKGKLLDTRLSELQHLIALEREAPDIAHLARTPEGRKQVIERIRREAAKASPGTPDGYAPEDVAAVSQIVRAQMIAAGLDPDKAKLTPEQEAYEREQVVVAREAAVTLKALKSIERAEFDPKWGVLNAIMKKAEADLPTAEFQALKGRLNDPRVLHEETGEPLFMHFWANVVTPEYNRIKKANQPAAPVVPKIPPKAPPASGGRMAPGSAISPSASTTPNVLKFKDDADFDRAFDEALSRG